MLSKFDSKSLYYSLFHQNPSAMLIINPDNGIIIDANKAACKFYQYAEEQLIGMNISEINTMSREEISQEMAEASDKHKTYFRFQHKKKDGEIRWVEVHLERQPFFVQFFKGVLA